MSGFLSTQLNTTRSELSRIELTMPNLEGSFPVMLPQTDFTDQILCVCQSKEEGTSTIWDRVYI